MLGALLMALGWAPFNFALGPMIGLAPILFWENEWQPDKKHLIKTWFGSYLFFALWNFFTIWWVKNADWLGVISSVLVNSIFYASFFTLFAFIRKNLKNKMGYLSLLILWVSWEYIELLDWDLSWPWMTLGFALADHPILIQWYSITGALGGSLWLLVINVFVYSIFQSFRYRNQFLRPRIRMLVIVSIAPIILSLVQYFNYDAPKETTKIMVVQPNIDPYTEKFASTGGRMSAMQQIHLMFELVNEKWSEDIDFILLPETALSDQIKKSELDKKTELQLVLNWAKTHPSTEIIIGASYAENVPIQDGEKLPYNVKRHRYTGEYYKNYNSAFHINSDGLEKIYHKSRLVIGVERLPSYFVALGRYLTEFEDDINATEYNPNNGTQPERDIFIKSDSAIKMGPIICYESVFGEYVTEYVDKGANVLGIITNDAWWGNTPGYKQHFAFAQMRAIETRRSIARSANTGWSGFISPRGDAIQKSRWWTKTAMIEDIPLNEEKTFYTKHGDFLGRISLPLCLLLIINAFIRRVKNKSALGRIT